MNITVISVITVVEMGGCFLVSIFFEVYSLPIPILVF
jgi:hypothetical protein